MSGQKRSSDPSSSAPLSAPPEKKKGAEGGEGMSTGSGGSTATAVETVIKLGGGSNQEEQDIKALQIKNRKLGEALDQRQVIEDELRERVERLETRQATDDASLLILNRYWNQFDENVRLIVRRYDQSGSEPVESQPPEGCSLKPGTPEPDGDSNQERAKDRGQQGEAVSSFLAMLASSTSEEIDAELQERLESSCKQARRVVEIYENLKNTVDQLKKDMESGTDGSLWDVAVCLNTLLTNENERLRQLTDSLQQKHSHMTSESRPLGRAANRADNRISELQVLIEELQWDMEKIRRRENRLNTHLAEVLERVNSKGYKVYGEASSVCGTITINKRKFEEMNSELEQNRELADNRLGELQKLQQDLQTVYQENNNMKVELLSRAEEVARESAEYHCLQSQFSVLYNESLVLKSQMDETKARLNTTRNARLRQLDHMENDEVSLQRKVRTEVIQLEDTLAQVRKEYEMLRIEFEQTLAANEQNDEVSLQRKVRTEVIQLEDTLAQVRKEYEMLRIEFEQTRACWMVFQRSCCGDMGSGIIVVSCENEGEEAAFNIDFVENVTSFSNARSLRNKMDELRLNDRIVVDPSAVAKIFKRLHTKKSSGPDGISALLLKDEEALRKIRSVEEQIDILNKKLSLAKQEEDALLSEMDVTGQAFEDMQEQNIRLMQQLREKDDANFKLMSERIKSNQIHKLLKEEKEELADQLLTLKTQVDAQLQVVRKLEEKERLLQGTISAAERELGLRTQALEMNKRKAQESVLLSEEVRSQLEGVQQRLSAVREEVIENSISREKESFNARRAQEDISKLRRKIEKAKKPAENVQNGDEILNEEINDYKARLTCPCCNSRVKDAVLTKCFHVFCFECVKTRYDTRQRKCPKCNAAFGANDFHRIYIG
ncbi:E3 ubiquitin-protein ligase BRE1A-like [Sinocyclocheilus grahami]|uniref:E3 ubiquitin-protein ligase BRE1A-like n=1 Tax=Sinocyclocheilus grahami TaxID=75366 RepID=UPI0007ACB21D|nr:PREDICTED: E3 ubiquitin-protein ligase BRE1A-like [Sinocyclocheilus grahami]